MRHSAISKSLIYGRSSRRFVGSVLVNTIVAEDVFAVVAFEVGLQQFLDKAFILLLLC